MAPHNAGFRSAPTGGRSGSISIQRKPDVVGTMTDMASFATVVDAVIPRITSSISMYGDTAGVAGIPAGADGEGLCLILPDLQSIASLVADDKLIEPATYRRQGRSRRSTCSMATAPR
jgi:hypothetical protein